MVNKRVKSIVTNDTYFKVGINCKNIEAFPGLFSVSFDGTEGEISVPTKMVWLAWWNEGKKETLSRATNYGNNHEPYHWEEGMGYPWTKNN